jgi:hypothetical protein
MVADDRTNLGNVRDGLKAGENAPELLDQLFWFASAQFIRTESFMTGVASQIALQERKKSRVTLDGREVSGIFMNMADTTSVMDRVRAAWPIAKGALETDYMWTVCHNHSERLFLTSDDPCQLDDRTQKVVMPLALDLAIIGEVVADNETPSLRHADATEEVIRQINQGVVKNCRSLVYSHEQSDDLREFVMKHYVFDPNPLSAGRSFANDPRPMTEQDVQRLMDRINEIRGREREQAQSGDEAETQPPPGEITFTPTPRGAQNLLLARDRRPALSSRSFPGESAGAGAGRNSKSSNNCACCSNIK